MKPLTIYHLIRAGGEVRYNETDEMIVIARTNRQARLFAAKCATGEGKDAWLNTKLSSCRTVKPGFNTQRLVIRSFCAG